MPQPQTQTEAGLFRSIEIVPEESSPVRTSRIIRAASIEAEKQRQENCLKAEQTAAEIIERAKIEGDALVQSMREAQEAEFQDKLLAIDSDVSSRLEAISTQLGEAVAATVDAIYRSVFETDPTLLIQATVKVAKRVLKNEINCTLRINPIYQHHESLASLASEFQLQTDQDIAIGTIIVQSDEGELKFDAGRLIADLGKNLRQFLRHAEQTTTIESRPL